MANYDIIGNLVVVKFDRDESSAAKKKWASAFLKTNKSVRTVLEKSQKFKGRLRTLKAKFIMGENTREALYRENGCEFRLNIETCYFSPRLSSERKELAEITKNGENVLVLFGGVAPFAIVIAKNGKAAKVTSVELGRECSKYAIDNVKRNKLTGKVEIIQGDVRKVLPKMREKFDRIVMARPNLEDDFLGSAIPRAKKGGIMHYYGFYEEEKKNEMTELILRRAKEAKRRVKITKIKEAGDIGMKKYRYRADIKFLN